MLIADPIRYVDHACKSGCRARIHLAQTGSAPETYQYRSSSEKIDVGIWHFLAIATMAAFLHPLHLLTQIALDSISVVLDCSETMTAGPVCFVILPVAFSSSSGSDSIKWNHNGAVINSRTSKFHAVESRSLDRKACTDTRSLQDTALRRTETRNFQANLRRVLELPLFPNSGHSLRYMK